MTTPGDFLAGTPARRGNTAWAEQVAETVEGVVRRASAGAARTVQLHLGPSELGAECDRMVVAKMAAAMMAVKAPGTADPWPSVVGTAVHAWLADAFAADDPNRWSPEMRVHPTADHPGTTDLYDWQEQAVLDHKILGEFSMASLRTNGPSRTYYAQLALYGLGCLRAGLPVSRIGIIAYPRQGSSLDGIYVWEHAMDAEVRDLLDETLRWTTYRTDVASHVVHEGRPLTSVSTTPGYDCHFCPVSGCADRRD